MTQYMLAVHHDWDADMPEPEEMEKQVKAVAEFNDGIMASGTWVFGGGLTHPSSATVVDNRTGDLLTTDGPFAETKEQLGGFWVIEAPDLDAALALAAEASAACARPVEVRPFQDEPPAE